MTTIFEGGNALVEGTKAYNDIQANEPGSPDAAAAMLGLAGIASGLLAPGGAFAQGLAVGVGVNAAALGVVLGGIQLGYAIDQYRDAMQGYDGAAQQVAYENLADKTCGVVAAIGGTIAAIPGFQVLGLGIWLGASLAQQYTNGNFGRLSDFIKWNVFHLDPGTNSYYNSARAWTAPRDPLVLDLDGNGIETVAINTAAPILFDMDADGTKTGTGWIKADDALVVLDRNGNGLIDSGAELLGDSTVLQNGPRAGQKAANGFEALADLDANTDGIINSADVAYANLRLWQDANQDGISQSTELKTLATLGIASIKVAGTASNVNLGGGNTQVLAGSFMRTNGQSGTAGVAELAGSLLLASNNFYREFTDDPVVTAAAAALLGIRWSGRPRYTKTRSCYRSNSCSRTFYRGFKHKTYSNVSEKTQ